MIRQKSFAHSCDWLKIADEIVYAHFIRFCNAAFHHILQWHISSDCAMLKTFISKLFLPAISLGFEVFNTLHLLGKHAL
ncbi:MAG: hypothetical protein ACK56F_26690, partial [bacterium]